MAGVAGIGAGRGGLRRGEHRCWWPAAIALSDDREGEDRTAARTLVGRWDDNALEVATLCMGALAAVALALGARPGGAGAAADPGAAPRGAGPPARGGGQHRRQDRACSTPPPGATQAPSRPCSRAQRHRGSVAVLILDLDHFKTVNDALRPPGRRRRAGRGRGRAAGRSRAPTTLVGRFGGEEFVVLLRDLPRRRARDRAVLHAVAERIRLRGRRARRCASSNPGCAATDRRAVGLHRRGHRADRRRHRSTRCCSAADASLYAAKRDGRNRVRIAGRTRGARAARTPSSSLTSRVSRARGRRRAGVRKLGR